MAIEDSRCKALPVREIYSWVEQHFPFYKAAAAGWKNSVRHNLSLNKCFKRVDRTPVSGVTRAVCGLWLLNVVLSELVIVSDILMPTPFGQ